MITSASELVAIAKSQVESLTAEQFAAERNRGAVIVDLREQDEREVHGVIPGSIHIPRGMVEFCADPALPIHAEQLHPSRRILLYCAIGNRSALAAAALKRMGFPLVAHLDGGFASWCLVGGAVESRPPAGNGLWAALLRR
jgi:rhodanese-related sulfurtransferase